MSDTTKKTELPPYRFRKWLDGKLPVTRAEFNRMPSDYKCHHSDHFGGPTIIYLSKEDATVLAPVVKVHPSQIEDEREAAKAAA